MSVTPKKERSVRDYVTLFFKGIAMGSCDIVPGVSGGTMAFILGIYEELIDSIKVIGTSDFIKAATRFRIKEIFEILNWKFLVALVAGIGVAVLSLARILESALENYPVYVWAFFFGLIIASIYTVIRKIKQWNWIYVIPIALAAIGAYVLVGLVPANTPDSWWFLLITGAIVICGMVLPGISGAFLLLLLGKYQFALTAINERDIVPIIFLGIGAVVGIVTFAQLLSWLFKKYHDVTVAVLTGIMIGSLRKVWPWKVEDAWLKDDLGEFIIRHGERVVTHESNVFPDLATQGSEALLAAGLALLGFLLIIVIERVAGE